MTITIITTSPPDAVISSLASNLTGRVTGEALMAKYTGSRVHPTREEIGRLAHQFYVARGRRDGHDLEDWLLAEQELVHHYR